MRRKRWGKQWETKANMKNQPKNTIANLGYNNMRTSIKTTDAYLYVIEGDLRRRLNEDGEELGYFPDLFVGLELMGKRYVCQKFTAWGYSAVSVANKFIEGIQKYGSVNLALWTQEDDRPFEQRYLEDMAVVEEMERNAEGY